MFYLTNNNPPDIEDEVDIYTQLHVKTKNILWKINMLASLQNQPELNTVCQTKSIIINKSNFLCLFVSVLIDILIFWMLFTQNTCVYFMIIHCISVEMYFYHKLLEAKEVIYK